MSKDAFLATISVLPVRDIDESTKWYLDVLGFETQYLHESDQDDEPANYAILSRENVVVHLILDEPEHHQPVWTKAGTGYLYLIVRNVDAVFAGVQLRVGQIARGLETENWGARGFNLTDPSGNAVHIEQAM